MVPYNYENFCDNLFQLVQEGKVPMSRIDDAVRRILRVKVELGLMEHPVTYAKDYPNFGSKAHEEASYQTAAEAITLLKNEGNILPLAKTTKVLVTGPNANNMRTLDGAWSYSWQGELVERFASKYNTILEAMQAVGGAANITYSPGVRYKAGGKYYEEEPDNLDAALAAAKNVDVILLCIGENSSVEKPGDLNDLNLSDLQLDLAQKMIATGKPVVLILNEGRPRIISRIEPGAKAVVDIYIPGNFGGNALADILYGDLNPSGRLPFNFPRYCNTLVPYIHKYSDEQKKAEGVYNYEADYSPQYEFGTGLSYTTFAYEKLAVNKPAFDKNETITLTVDVANTGKRAGKVAVELYSSDLIASQIAPDVRRLRRFEKIALAVGEHKTVTFTLPVAELAYAGPDGKPVLEDGEIVLKVGDQKVSVQVK
jgi:beta-glucosidase